MYVYVKNVETISYRATSIMRWDQNRYDIVYVCIRKNWVESLMVSIQPSFVVDACPPLWKGAAKMFVKTIVDHAEQMIPTTAYFVLIRDYLIELLVFTYTVGFKQTLVHIRIPRSCTIFGLRSILHCVSFLLKIPRVLLPSFITYKIVHEYFQVIHGLPTVLSTLVLLEHSQ